jgi:protein-disulfide isomerase
MHDLLLSNQDKLTGPNLLGYARRLGLDEQRFREDLMRHAHAGRVALDVESADASGVSGTPTFFVNGLRQYGAYDVATLGAAVRAARAQVRAAR